MTSSIGERIAVELGVRAEQVTAAIGLLDGGATVPFIARYRKEMTGTLDDAQLRTLEERLRYLRELDERREAVLEAIRAQGKLDAELEARILAADSKARLEDLYPPFKPKRRTKAQLAREAGLEPLADQLLADPSVDPLAAAAAFVDADKGVEDAQAALEGARAILVERFAEDADLIGALRERMWSRGRLVSRVRDGKQEAGDKFADYFDFAEPFVKLPSHRILAMFRGESEEVLDLTFDPEPAPRPAAEPAQGAGAASAVTPAATSAPAAATSARVPATGTSAPAALSGYELEVARRFAVADRGRPGDRWLLETVRWAWRTRILVHLGLDPGFRTGVKVAVVDATGKAVATRTIHPHQPQRRWDEALELLAGLARGHQVELIAIGNGTASRETDRLAADLIGRYPELRLTKVVVSEAGASVYSASAYASRELPELDVSLRGAVSIARRLQDPLAELVKIDPRSIGVGQYQHDLSQSKLSRSLDAVVEDCVNAVGVDLNTASVPLLGRVSGIGGTLAENIVAHRDANGPFRSRRALSQVPRLGPKAFQQCAGFLRVRGGDDPLDASSVHPEAYPVVRRILRATTSDIASLIGNTAVLRALEPERFAGEGFGLPTVTDILQELEKPGRDPRPAFRTATFAEGVDTLEDLKPGMVLEGVVTNVAAFGAFVDVGVHSDGLVHVSAMSNVFVRDPRDVVKPGDVVRVRVLGVDIARKRISLSLRLDEDPTGRSDRRQPPRSGPRDRDRPARPAPDGRPPRERGGAVPDTALAEALRRAGLVE